MTLDPALAASGSLLLAAIFAIAGAAKLRRTDAFAGVVENYRLLPRALVRPAAIGLPIVELAAGVGLLVPAVRPWAAALVAILLLLFAWAMAVNLNRGRAAIDCGCALGLFKERISWPLVARNLVLAAAAAVIAVSTPTARSFSPVDWFSIIAAIGCGLLLYAAVGRLFGLAPASLKGAS